MIEQIHSRFVPRTAPPDQPAEPAYWFIFQGNNLIVQEDRQSRETPESASADGPVTVPQITHPAELGITPLRTHYLGYLQTEQGKVHCYSAEVAEERVEEGAEDTAWSQGLIADGLRPLHARLGEEMFSLAGRAVQIVDWDRTHQFCGRCGAPMETLDYERAKKCPVCGLTNYPRLSPAIIIAVTRCIDGQNRLLLARNHRFPPDRYSVIAGFVEPGESLEACARREVYEEVGIHIQNIRYFGSQAWPFPNSLMLGFTAEYAGGEFVLEEEEIADARWFAPADFPKLPPKISIARRLIDAFVADNDPGATVREW